jgi:hypothetical protein
VNVEEMVAVLKLVDRITRPLLVNCPPLIAVSPDISMVRTAALLMTAVLSSVRLPTAQLVLELS